MRKSNILSKTTGKIGIHLQNTEKGCEKGFFLLKNLQKVMSQKVQD